MHIEAAFVHIGAGCALLSRLCSLKQVVLIEAGGTSGSTIRVPLPVNLKLF